MELLLSAISPNSLKKSGRKRIIYVTELDTPSPFQEDRSQYGAL
jgi:hypothetical protein